MHTLEKNISYDKITPVVFMKNNVKSHERSSKRFISKMILKLIYLIGQNVVKRICKDGSKKDEGTVTGVYSEEFKCKISISMKDF